MWNVLGTTFCHHLSVKSLLLTTPHIIDLALKVVGGQLLYTNPWITYYVVFAFTE